MTHVLVTPERAAFLRQRLKEKFAEREAAKANFAATCARLATEPRSSFGEFALSFEEVAPTTMIGADPALIGGFNPDGHYRRETTSSIASFALSRYSFLTWTRWPLMDCFPTKTLENGNPFA